MREPHTVPSIEHVHSPCHRAHYAACWETGAVLYTIPEEPERAIIEVEKESHAVGKSNCACFVFKLLAIAMQAPSSGKHEPG